MVTLGRRLLRAIVRRTMPGAPLGGVAAPPSIERDVAGPDGPIPVVEQGEGPAVLILHGGSGDVTSWAGVAGRLAARHHVTRFSRHTYRIDPPPRTSAMAAEVADVLAVADALPRPLLVVGHSSGAVVALQSALAAPDRFAGMVLYEPPLAVSRPLGGDALRRARAALDAGRPDRAMAIHMRELVGLPALTVAAMNALPPVRRALGRYTAAQIADDEALEALGVGLDRYAGLAVPALLLGGARSPRHLRERLAALAGVLPRVESLVELPGQGHSANMRAPDAVARVIADFADRLSR